MIRIFSDKRKNHKKDKSKLRAYWSILYPKKYVKDLVSKVNG
jgi:hypothetical protein